MDAQHEKTVDEIKRLQRCINDLVSVLALPAMWSGGEPSQILHTFLDALLVMLQLDLLYLRVNGPASEPPIEAVRVAPSNDRTPRPQEICKVINQWFGDDPLKWPPRLLASIGDGNISIVPSRLGLHGEIGLIVAGSERADFPSQTESLLLSVAANQVVIGLQEARLLSEQRRVASQLDRRVAQRTAELAQTSEPILPGAGKRTGARYRSGRTLAGDSHIAGSRRCILALWFWLLPSWLGFHVDTSGAPQWRWIAVVPSVLGFAVALRCAWDFGWTGRGRRAPIAPPKSLVVVGSYRHVRNPMYLGFLGEWLGHGRSSYGRIWSQSRPPRRRRWPWPCL
jgi:hypothetical protein